MTRVFVYEYCVALGLGREVSDPAHSLFREGTAMRDAAADDFRRVPGVEVLTLDGAGGGDEERRFRELAGAADVTLVVAPEFDGLLEARSGWVPPGRLLGCSPEALRLTGDKLALAAVWQRAGVPTPATGPATDWPADRVPAVVKPRDGAGSTATVFCPDRAAFLANRDAAAAEWPGELIAQNFAPGRPASVAFLVGPAPPPSSSPTSGGGRVPRTSGSRHSPGGSPGPPHAIEARGREPEVRGTRPPPEVGDEEGGVPTVIPLVPTFQRLSADGRFTYEGGELPIPPDLAERAVALGRRAIACVPGLLGFVGVDLVLGDAADGSGDVAIEINPRLSTSYVGLRALADFNLAGAMLRIATGEPVPEPKWKTVRIRFRPDGTRQRVGG